MAVARDDLGGDVLAPQLQPLQLDLGLVLGPARLAQFRAGRRRIAPILPRELRPSSPRCPCSSSQAT